VSLPTPQPGLVISYAYLWSREHDRGTEEGVKDRPCAIVAARQIIEGREVVTVVPITHMPPTNRADAVEIPPALKSHLGLDDTCNRLSQGRPVAKWRCSGRLTFADIETRGTGAKLGVRRQQRLAGMSRWLDGISVRIRHQAYHYRPRTEPEAAGRRRAVTSAFADFC
jgi:PemK-like, MazF-like toxin of type II toxin-antitoxin system